MIGTINDDVDDGSMALSLCANCRVKIKLSELKLKVVSLVTDIRNMSVLSLSITAFEFQL